MAEWSYKHLSVLALEGKLLNIFYFNTFDRCDSGFLSVHLLAEGALILF